MRHSLRIGAALSVGVLFTASAPAANEEAIKAAIDRGVAAVKQVQPNGGGGRHGNQVGATALVALTLLECDVPAKDPAIQQAAAFIRLASVDLTHTYSLALAIMFLDRLGEGDLPLIQSMSVRLMAGQNAAGGWSYNCPRPTDFDMQRMQLYLKDRDSIGAREAPKSPGKDKPILPKDLRAIVDALNRGAGLSRRITAGWKRASPPSAPIGRGQFQYAVCHPGPVGRPTAWPSCRPLPGPCRGAFSRQPARRRRLGLHSGRTEHARTRFHAVHDLCRSAGACPRLWRRQ